MCGAGDAMDNPGWIDAEQWSDQGSIQPLAVRGTRARRGALLDSCTATSAWASPCAAGGRAQGGEGAVVPLHPSPGAVRSAPVAAAIGGRDFFAQENVVRRDEIFGLHADGVLRETRGFGTAAAHALGHVSWGSVVGSEVAQGDRAGGTGAAQEAEQEELPDGAQPELFAQRSRRLLWAQLLQRTTAPCVCAHRIAFGRWALHLGGRDHRPAEQELVLQAA